jgi:cytochrome c
MYTRSFVAIAALLASSYAVAQQGPNLGEPISAADLAPWDISIETNGDGLPPGSGSVAQGQAIYEVQCLACHGAEGQDGLNDRLAGGHGTLAEPVPVRTIGSFWPYASTVFDYVRRAMPFNTPQTLSDDDVYAVTAYLLYLNGIIDEGTSLNARRLQRIEMPNADGFILAYPAISEE